MRRTPAFDDLRVPRKLRRSYGPNSSLPRRPRRAPDCRSASPSKIPSHLSLPPFPGWAVRVARVRRRQTVSGRSKAMKTQIATITDISQARTSNHRLVSRDEWLAERKRLLAREKELTHLRDQIAGERRALPWVRI